MRLPKRISPCPIVDGVIEIRFETDFPDDAAFGLLFSAVKNDYPHFVKLPVDMVLEARMDQFFSERENAPKKIYTRGR